MDSVDVKRQLERLRHGYGLGARVVQIVTEVHVAAESARPLAFTYTLQRPAKNAQVSRRV